MGKLFDRFWAWYERNLTFNLAFASFLFVWQVVHLYWLAAHVIAVRLTGHSFFDLTPFWYRFIIIVDYTEIPALVSTGFIYVNELRRGFRVKSSLYLAFLLLQIFHMFWITDEFVVTSFNGAGTILPFWLAWVAISIDYLEVPVMIDTLKKFFIAMRERRVGDFLKNELRAE